MKVLLLAATAALAVLSGAALGQATFTGIGLPDGATGSAGYAMSGDGATVVGAAFYANGTASGFSWTAAAGFSNLGGFIPSASSTAGTVLAGELGGRAARWISAGPVTIGPDTPNTVGNAVSGDGAVIVGDSYINSTFFSAFRWTSAGGLQNLSPLFGDYGSRAYGLSTDGVVSVGSSHHNANGSGQIACRWVNGGSPQGLGTLGGLSSAAYATNADGTVIVGSSEIAAGGPGIAFRWTSANGITSLGVLPGGGGSVARSVSADGSTIVGFGGGGAFVWTESLGPTNLSAHLSSLGVDLSGWTLSAAYSVSADGRTIMGTGVHLGHGEAWVATIPAPSGAAPLVVAGLVASRTRRRAAQPTHRRPI